MNGALLPIAQFAQHHIEIKAFLVYANSPTPVRACLFSDQRLPCTISFGIGPNFHQVPSTRNGGQDPNPLTYALPYMDDHLKPSETNVQINITTPESSHGHAVQLRVVLVIHDVVEAYLDSVWRLS